MMTALFHTETDAGALERSPLGVELAQRLSRAIVRGEYASNERLIETEICERYRISRSPLREALGYLESLGLVVRRPRYGVRVAPLSLGNLDDITTCRIPLEACAAELVAALPERMRVADLLSGHIERMRAAEAEGDIDACFEANLDLIEDLHRSNPNPLLGRLLAQLNLPAQRYRYLVYRHRPETLRMLIASNERLIEAIRNGDARHAHKVTKNMVKASWKDLRKHLSELIPATEEEA